MGRGLVRRTRHHRAPRADRQRLLLPLPGLGGRLRRPRSTHNRTRLYQPQTKDRVAETRRSPPPPGPDPQKAASARELGLVPPVEDEINYYQHAQINALPASAMSV